MGRAATEIQNKSLKESVSFTACDCKCMHPAHTYKGEFEHDKLVV